MKNENPILISFPSFLKKCLVDNSWVLSIRPKTLIAGISPVLIGTAICATYQTVSCSIFILCMLFSILLQIGTNWANDYFDFIKGTDTYARKGPHRALQTNQIAPKTMRNAAFSLFFLAGLVSLPLIARIGIFFSPLMLLCIACAIFYTAGKRALGYLGFGDLLVVIFYGPIATCGTIFAQTLFIPPDSWIVSLIPASMACALICINNMRDFDEDQRANKLTPVVRFGIRFGQIEYTLCLLTLAIVPLLLTIIGWPTTILAVWFVLPLAKEPLQIVFNQTNDHNRALSLTARIGTIYTIIFCLAIYAHLHL